MKQNIKFFKAIRSDR